MHLHSFGRSRRSPWISCSGAVVLLAGICASSLVAAPAAERIFTKKDLEEIRGVVIRYYEEKKPKHWEVFVEELKRGGIFLKEEFPGFGPSIGFWKCEADENGVDLVRDPGLSESGEPLAIQFYVRLVKKDGRWTAIEHSYREVRWEPGPLEDPPPGTMW